MLPLINLQRFRDELEHFYCTEGYTDQKAGPSGLPIDSLPSAPEPLSSGSKARAHDETPKTPLSPSDFRPFPHYHQ
jgi:hypothetical protein